MKFHHIGVACNDISYMKSYLKNLYDIQNISEKIFDERKGVELCMIKLNDGTRIELVSGAIMEDLLNRRNYLYHICYSTENIEMKISEFENCGAKVVSQPKPTKLFNGRRAAFLLTKLGLVELLEEREDIGLEVQYL